ncbi:MAG: CRISPR-associated endonuclease Cas3'', partial [Bryobacteraceae bacterium]
MSSHLRSVAEIAEKLAREAAPARPSFHKAARASGLLHDVGKYSLDFQQLIRGVHSKRVVHANHGAALAYRARALECAFAIAAHHAGLCDPKGDRSCLIEKCEAFNSEVEALWASAMQDCPELVGCSGVGQTMLERTARGPGFDLRTRMLLSCLVDADRIDTARHCQEDRICAQPLDADRRLQQLLGYIRLRATGVPEGDVKRAREAVLDACLRGADNPGNLFSLTVPTGGGKTLASMAFALNRAARMPDRVRRIIVVIPYLSIIEQNAVVYQQALGEDAVLEHHSGDFHADEDSEGTYTNPTHRRATENWDAPVVVTTSVRFFESLFSNRPKDLRRVHNIA